MIYILWLYRCCGAPNYVITAVLLNSAFHHNTYKQALNEDYT